MKNYYEILEVDKNASLETIKKVFKYLIKKNHPDLFTGSEKDEAEKKTIMLNEAYEVLSKPDKRKAYDEGLEIATKSQETLLKEELKVLKASLDKKDFIIENFLDDQAVDELSKIFDSQISESNYSEGYEKVDNEEMRDSSIFKDVFSYLIKLFKDIFLKPMILILSLILILFILQKMK